MGSKRIAGPPPKRRRERLPEHIKMTLREYKKLKRRQALEVTRALEALHAGCAWMPPVNGVYIGQILSQIERARREWRQWWRNA